MLDVCYEGKGLSVHQENFMFLQGTKVFGKCIGPCIVTRGEKTYKKPRTRKVPPIISLSVSLHYREILVTVTLSAQGVEKLITGGYEMNPIQPAYLVLYSCSTGCQSDHGTASRLNYRPGLGGSSHKPPIARGSCMLSSRVMINTVSRACILGGNSVHLRPVMVTV